MCLASGAVGAQLDRAIGTRLDAQAVSHAAELVRPYDTLQMASVASSIMHTHDKTRNRFANFKIKRSRKQNSLLDAAIEVLRQEFEGQSASETLDVWIGAGLDVVPDSRGCALRMQAQKYVSDNGHLYKPCASLSKRAQEDDNARWRQRKLKESAQDHFTTSKDTRRHDALAIVRVYESDKYQKDEARKR